MKKIIYSLLILWLTTPGIYARTIEAKEEPFYFQFNNEELVDVVNRLAAKKEINIVFPVKSPLTARITMAIDDPFTIDQAWEKLYTILDLAGYSLINKGAQYTIVKTEAGKDGVIREPVPIYIGVSPEKLPDSDERIRYIYYLTNFKIGDNFDKSELFPILQNIFPDTASYLGDPQTNGIILTDKSSNIKSAMDIIAKLDNMTLQETFEVIPLHNTSAQMIKDIFYGKDGKQGILGDDNKNQYGFEAKKQQSETNYFPKNVRIIPITRTNSILVLGTKTAIQRIRDFLTKYIDVELESGKSILHIYKLQYMDANDIKKVLEDIVKPMKKGSTGQSAGGDKASAGVNPSTQERVFDEIIIQTDVPANKDDKNKQYFGNNNLIVACRNDDWVKIKGLIEQLDQPQSQVIIEILVADLTLQDTRDLGAITRNPLELGFPPGVNIQAAQIGLAAAVVPNSPISNASSLACDLASTSNLVPNPNSTTTPPGLIQQSVLASVPVGATAIAINDGGTNSAWSVFQMLDLFTYNKVISNPHLIATNGTPAKVVIGQTRLIQDQTAGSGGGTAVVNLKDIGALLQINLTPRIYTSDAAGGKDDTVSLSVTVEISNFIAGTNTNNARQTRTVETCAMLKNGQILALGGLINHEIDDAVNETPILAKIPILGWFAKQRNNNYIDNNLTIFIAPTIIEPRLRGGTGQYTEDYSGVIRQYCKESEAFDSLQDPITRWFFKNDYDPQKELKEFMDLDEFKRHPDPKQYKSLVDTEQAASVEEANAPDKKNKDKKSKRIVLTNVDKKEDVTTVIQAPHDMHTATPTPDTSTKVAAAEKPTALADVVSSFEPLPEQSTSMTVASAPAPQRDMNALRSQLQKILEAEENPLL